MAESQQRMDGAKNPVPFSEEPNHTDPPSTPEPEGDANEADEDDKEEGEEDEEDENLPLPAPPPRPLRINDEYLVKPGNNHHKLVSAAMLGKTEELRDALLRQLREGAHWEVDKCLDNFGHGLNALHIAVVGGNIDCVKMLVNEFKAKIDAAVDTKALQPSDEGEEGPTTMTPMNLARAEASKEIAQFLQSELQKQGIKMPDPNAPRQMNVYAAAVSLVIISACWIWGLMTR